MLTTEQTSLCCDAPINEQFAICTDCKEHAEYLNPIVTDERGILVFENAPAHRGPLVDENGRPLTTESFRETFQRNFNLDTDSLAGVCLILIIGLVFYGLTVMFG